MNPIAKWGGIVLGTLLGLAVLGGVYVYFASEMVIGRNYQTRTVAFHAPHDAAAAARGAHLAVVAGCTDCHGAALTGKKFDDVPDATMWSRNLRRLDFTDAQFEAAIRQGVRPDGKSVVIMPSNAYADMSDRDLGDLVAYLRSLKPQATATPEPRYGLTVRIGILLGMLKTNRDYARGDTPPLDVGPGFARGRQIAGLACAECHNTDLGGGRADSFFQTPDLSLIAAYERADFIAFMRTGKAAGARELAVMSDTARLRFSHFTDAEIDALYDYLVARGRKVTDNPG
jgi:cytochrome c553